MRSIQYLTMGIGRNRGVVRGAVLQLGFNLRDSGAETALDLGYACAFADVSRQIEMLKIGTKLSQQFFRRLGGSSQEIVAQNSRQSKKFLLRK